jgi:cytosine/adenosine deaminase-related metal-dependent hydrolase
VTAVGDISLNPALSRAVLNASPLRGVSFGEVLGMAGRAGQMEGRIEAAVDQTFERDGLRAGIEPHAPYSLDLAGYRRCVDEAKRRGLPIATHLAETPDEAAFLADHSGEFARLWAALGEWQDGVSRAEGGPIRAMAALGLLGLPAVLAHVNYADDDELAVLAGGRASVVYCPRTHAYFGHRPHRFREMLAQGINVALGTDSVASSGDLNLMDEARLLHRIAPGMSEDEVLGMVTWRGARALGMEEEVGRIAAGMRADFSVWPVESRDPLRELLERDVRLEETWIDGHRHPEGV